MEDKKLSAREMESLAALCDTFLPSIDVPNDVIVTEPILKLFKTSASEAGTPDHVVELINRRLRYHTLLGRLALILLSTWIGTLILCGRASISSQFPFVHKFSKLRLEKRQQAILSWSTSWIFLIRLLFAGFKSIIPLAFFTQMRMSKFSKTAHLLAIGRDKGSGEIISQNPKNIQYRLTDTDVVHLKVAVEKMLRILAAAGAEEIGTHHRSGPMINVKKATSHELERFIKKASSLELQDQTTQLSSAHQMGSCRMGVDPKTSAVDRRAETWEVEGLFVADTSVYPTALGVNPMVTVMAISYCTAQYVLEVLKKHHNV